MAVLRRRMLCLLTRARAFESLLLLVGNWRCWTTSWIGWNHFFRITVWRPACKFLASSRTIALARAAGLYILSASVFVIALGETRFMRWNWIECNIFRESYWATSEWYEKESLAHCLSSLRGEQGRTPQAYYPLSWRWEYVRIWFSLIWQDFGLYYSK